MPRSASLMSGEVSTLMDAVAVALIDPIWWRKYVLRVDNDPWQDEILQAFADIWRKEVGLPTVVNHAGLNRISVRSGHGPGKTVIAAELIHYCNFVHKSQIVCTAPKEKQLRTRLWPRFRMLKNKAIKEYQDLIQVDETKITWCGDTDWMATYETAAQPENLQGYHPNGPDDWVLIIVDEASGVNNEMFRVLEGALATPHTALLLIGNPTQNTGEFYESHNRPKVRKLYYQRHVQPQESKFVAPEYIEQLIERFGRESPVTKVRGFGEFAELSENQLISLAWIASAREREFETDGSLSHKVISVDVADGGENFSSITLGEHYETITRLMKQVNYSFPAAKSPIMAGEAAERMWAASKCSARAGDFFVVDSIGVGAGTAGYLLKEGYPVVLFRGGETSTNPKLWRNRRTQSALVMRNGFRDGTIVIEDDFVETDDEWMELEAQLCSLKSKPGSERVEDILTKKEMQALGLVSPDRADSVMMQLATQIPVFQGTKINASKLLALNSQIRQSEAARDNW